MQNINYVVRDEVGRLFKGTLDTSADAVVLRASEYSDVSLNLSSEMVSGYERQGDNLVIQLEDGREVVLEGMFNADMQSTKLYFSTDGEIQEVSFSESWGRTTYAHYGNSSEATGLTFADGNTTTAFTGATTDAGYAMTTVSTTQSTVLGAGGLWGGGAAATGVGATTGFGGGMSGLGAAGAVLGGVGLVSSLAGGGAGAAVVPLFAMSDGILIRSIGGGDDNVVNNAEMDAGLTVVGTSYPNSVVTVKMGNVTRTATTDDKGEFSATFDSSELISGENVINVSASVTNDKGDVETAQADVKIDTITNVSVNDLVVEGDGIIAAAETSDGVEITGSAEAGATVVVSVLGATQTATAGDDGSWFVTFNGALFKGKNAEQVAIKADATDTYGNVATTTGAVTVDTLVTVSIDPVQAGDDVINRAEALSGVTFTGNTDPGSSVLVELNGTTVDAIVGVDGGWTALMPVDAIPTSNTQCMLNVHATDEHGNTSSDNHVIKVDTTGAVEISNAPIEIDGVVSKSERLDGVTISGTTTPGSTVVVDFDKFSGEVDNVDSNGNWVVDVPAKFIDTGEHDVTITATATTANGNVSTDTQEVRVDTFVNQMDISDESSLNDGYINAGEHDEGVTLTGTVEKGSAVRVELGGESKDASVDENGTWKVTFEKSDLAPGAYDTQMIATAIDAAGNEKSLPAQKVSVDTLGPTLSLSAAPIEGDNIINGVEAQDGVDVSGSADAGATVTVTFKGVSHDTTADSNGNWVTTFTAQEIGSGEFDAPITAHTTDAAGNVMQVDATVKVDTIVKNVTMPAAPMGDDATINAQEAVGGVPLSGTGEPGATVEVTFNGDTFTGTVKPEGDWTVQIPESAIPTVEVSVEIGLKITDKAGNFVSDTVTTKIDPLVTKLDVTSTSMDGKTILNAQDAEGGIKLAGTVEEGSTVTVKLAGAEKPADVDSNGNWSVTFQRDEMKDGEYEATAEIFATDAAGNTREISGTDAPKFVMDTSVPDSPLIASVDQGPGGVFGVTIDDASREYDLVAVNNEATSTYEVGYDDTAKVSRDQMVLEFDNGLVAGTDFIVSTEDAAGNKASTLVITDTGEDPVIDMGDAGYSGLSIQAVDLEFADDVELQITAEQLENLSDISDTLRVSGGEGNTLEADGAVKQAGTQTINGETYDVYTLGDDGAQLIVDQDITLLP